MTTLRVALLIVLAAAPPGCAATSGENPAAAPSPPQRQNVNADAQAQKSFLDRVQQYLELRKREEAKLPRLSDEAKPDAITAHQKALLKGIQNARKGATQGEIFDPEISALIRREVSRAMTQQGTASKDAIQDENPGTLSLTVNGPYPTTAPLPTVPPRVLNALPRLPDEQLEYRFVGHRLILLDARPNMVVDYMDRALP